MFTVAAHGFFAVRQNGLQHILADGKNTASVFLHDFGDAAAELFDKIEVFEDSHNLAVARDGGYFVKFLQRQAFNQAAEGGDFKPVGINLENWRVETRIVVVRKGVDNHIVGIMECGFLTMSQVMSRVCHKFCWMAAGDKRVGLSHLPIQANACPASSLSHVARCGG